MTDIEKKALALMNEVRAERGWRLNTCVARGICGTSVEEALYRAIEQHEAFRREVSDAVERWFACGGCDPTKGLVRFIIPKPVDPLVDALDDMKDGRAGGTTESYATCLRAAMKARGYEWTKIEAKEHLK